LAKTKSSVFIVESVPEVRIDLDLVVDDHDVSSTDESSGIKETSSSRVVTLVIDVFRIGVAGCVAVVFVGGGCFGPAPVVFDIGSVC
jgi:hypothetical protein